MKKRINVEVTVSGNPDKSLRQIRKKMEREGIMRHIKRSVSFEPPTQKRRKKLMRAIKNNVMKNYEYTILKRLD